MTGPHDVPPAVGGALLIGMAVFALAYLLFVIRMHRSGKTCWNCRYNVAGRCRVNMDDSRLSWFRVCHQWSLWQRR